MNYDTDAILENETGPAEFRVINAPAKLAVSSAGTLKTWQGNAWDSGVSFTESQTITAPGQYQITLDVAGYASVQDNNGQP